MRTKTATLALTFLTGGAALTGCGQDETISRERAAGTNPSASSSPSTTPSGSGSPSPSATPTEASGPVLDVIIDGDKVIPDSKRFDLSAGKPLIITFKTDRAGELHVHSRPEQYVKFLAGTSTKKLVIKVPGVVDVEEHDTSKLVAQIEVR